GDLSEVRHRERTRLDVLHRLWHRPAPRCVAGEATTAAATGRLRATDRGGAAAPAGLEPASEPAVPAVSAGAAAIPAAAVPAAAVPGRRLRPAPAADLQLHAVGDRGPHRWRPRLRDPGGPGHRVVG